MCSDGFLRLLPKGSRNKSAGSGEPIPSGGLRVRASPATVMNRCARQRMTTTRAHSGSGLENAPATIRGQRIGPTRGKGTEYAGQIRPLLRQELREEGWSSPKAERAKLWKEEEMKVRERLFHIQNGLCAICGEMMCLTVPKRGNLDMKATIEHVLPKSLGGRNDPSNYVVTHHKCNTRRGSAPPTPRILTVYTQVQRAFRQQRSDVESA